MKTLVILIFLLFTSPVFAQDSIRIGLSSALKNSKKTSFYFVGGKVYSSKDAIPYRFRFNPRCHLKLKPRSERNNSVSVVSIRNEVNGIHRGSYRLGLCGAGGPLGAGISYLIGTNVIEKAKVRLSGNGNVSALTCQKNGDTTQVAVTPNTIKSALGKNVKLDTRDYRGIAVTATSGGKPCAERGNQKERGSPSRNTRGRGSSGATRE